MCVRRAEVRECNSWHRPEKTTWNNKNMFGHKNCICRNFFCSAEPVIFQRQIVLLEVYVTVQQHFGLQILNSKMLKLVWSVKISWNIQVANSIRKLVPISPLSTGWNCTDWLGFFWINIFRIPSGFNHVDNFCSRALGCKTIRTCSLFKIISLWSFRKRCSSVLLQVWLQDFG